MKYLKFTILFFFFILATLVTAQKKPFTISDLYKIQKLQKPILSNDGSKFAIAATKYDLPNLKQIA